MSKTRINPTSTNATDHSQRIFELYQELERELNTIGQEAQHLRVEIQKVIDKKQMYRVLQELNEGHH